SLDRRTLHLLGSGERAEACVVRSYYGPGWHRKSRSHRPALRNSRQRPAGCGIDVFRLMARAPVRYATTSDRLEIAYQVLGDGPIDVVIVPGLFSNIDRNADGPFYGGYLRRFPRFARTIVLDRRGGGVSDREVGSGSPEDRMDDIRAVMDAV